MKQLPEHKNKLITIAVIAAAALALSACGGPPAQAAEHEEPEPGTPTVEYGTLDQATGGSNLVPRHLSPKPGVTLEEAMPSFVWTAVPGASGFEVQVSEDRRFPGSKTVASGVVKGPPWTSSEELDAGGEYYWRIRAVFPSDTRGPWSDHSPFDLAAAPESVPAAVTEGSGSSIAVEAGDRGAVVANLSVWDASSQVLMTTPGRDLEDVLKSLEPGRVYQFVATLDMLIRPEDFGIDHSPIRLTGGKQQLVFW